MSNPYDRRANAMTKLILLVKYMENRNILPLYKLNSESTPTRNLRMLIYGDRTQHENDTGVVHTEAVILFYFCEF